MTYYSQKRPEIIDLIPTGLEKILDIGCGDGSFGSQLSGEIWGIEINNTVANEASKKLHKIIVGDALKVIDDAPNYYFDCIFLNDILEHLINPEELLVKIKKKLNDTGIVIFSIPNIRYVSVLKELLIDKQFRYTNKGIMDKTHLRFFTEKSIKEMLTKCDYEIIKFKGVNPIKTSWKFNMVNMILLGNLSDIKYHQFAGIVRPRG